VGHIEI
jgi:hypothetical protein